MNWGKKLREEGPDSFFRPVQRGGGRVMTAEKAIECAGLLAAGLSIEETAGQAGIKSSTLRKAMARGAVARPSEEAAAPPASAPEAPTKSDRSRQDAEAAEGLGMACTRADERVAAAVGLAGSAVTRFEAGRDVEMGGLLAGLPALCDNGLLSGLGKYMDLPRGFYSAAHILLTLGFMALGRIRRPEGLRHRSPGELGKVLGLDRVPEVKTLRKKIAWMARTGHPRAWMLDVSQGWMEADPVEAGYCYLDGHVRVYYGKAAHLPARYVSRQRLCLRGTTDYWVNDALGRPFFVIPKAVTEGLGTTLLEDIVPILLKSVPGQPSQEELDADPLLHRFVIIFDREGAYPALAKKLWDDYRIGMITYRKNVQDPWPEEEFKEVEVALPGGAVTVMKLALRETPFASKDVSIPVTEVRRLTPSGHQTAVISTARRLENTVVAGRMFSRWCQENYFAYAMKHYDIDGLVEYGTEEIPGTTMIVNPVWRNLDKDTTTARKALRGLQAKLGARPGPDGAAAIQKNAELLERIQAAQTNYEELRAKRKQTPRKVELSSLPEEQRPTALRPLNKTLTDTIKMIAYRAETALVALLIPHLNKEQEARALIRELFISTADIEPHDAAQTLTVRVHHMTSPAHDKALAALLDELTQREFRHPETGQRIVYTLL